MRPPKYGSAHEITISYQMAALTVSYETYWDCLLAASPHQAFSLQYAQPTLFTVLHNVNAHKLKYSCMTFVAGFDP
jgi:hypothetical protein